VFPELTEERRKRLHQDGQEAAEDGKVAVRNVRRSARDAMQKLEDDGEVGRDEHERYQKQLEELTGKHVASDRQAARAEGAGPPGGLSSCRTRRARDTHLGGRRGRRAGMVGGRNLPLAIAVGLVLASIFLGSLFWHPAAFTRWSRC
jgi:hypothetical protein